MLTLNLFTNSQEPVEFRASANCQPNSGRLVRGGAPVSVRIEGPRAVLSLNGELEQQNDTTDGTAAQSDTTLLMLFGMPKFYYRATPNCQPVEGAFGGQHGIAPFDIKVTGNRASVIVSTQPVPVEELPTESAS